MAADERYGSLLTWIAYIGIFGFIYLIGVVVPSVSFIMVVLLPLPMVYLALDYHLKYGLLGLALAGLIIFLALPEPEVLITLGQYGLLGLGLGLLFKNMVSSGKILIFAILISLGLAAGSLGAAYYLSGTNLLVLSPEDRQTLIEQWKAMNEQVGLFQEEVFTEGLSGDEKESLQYLADLYEYYLPSQVAVATAFATILTFIFATFLAVRWGRGVIPGPAFVEMYLPWYSIWLLIIGLLLLLLGENYIEAMAKPGKNLLFVLACLYLVMGLSVFVYYYKKIQALLLLKLLIVAALVFCYPLSICLLVLIGATDPLINFRRLPRVE